LLKRYWHRYWHPQGKGQRNPFAAKSFLNSVGFALAGLAYALHQERNLRIHLALMAGYGVMIAVLVVAGYPMPTGLRVWAALTMMLLILLCELANTIVELLVDWLCNQRFDLRAKTIKDIAAGACLLASGVGYGLLLVLFFIE